MPIDRKAVRGSNVVVIKLFFFPSVKRKMSNFFRALSVLNTASISYLSFQYISRQNIDEKIHNNLEKIQENLNRNYEIIRSQLARVDERLYEIENELEIN